jgi:hypothetical protein
MERKWIIAIFMIAIVFVGFLGWYFLFRTQKAKTVAVAEVYINTKNYTTPNYNTPIIWNLTASPNATLQSPSYNITNTGSNATSMAFNYTIWHLENNRWIEQWNGTRWFNGTTWLADSATVQPSIAIVENTTYGPGWTAFANKTSSGESSTYYYNLTYNDQMIYLNLNYLGSNPTVDGQTVFAYVAFDGNGNGILDANDRAFNFTSNPSLPIENNLRIYTPSSNSSWNTTPANEYSWNGNVSSSGVPITVVCSNSRTNIMFAIPFSYIGATMSGSLGFVLQAFSHDWVPSTANATTPANYTEISLNLPPVVSFDLESHTTLRFYTRAAFASAAKGDYSIVFQFQATIQNSS